VVFSCDWFLSFARVMFNGKYLMLQAKHNYFIQNVEIIKGTPTALSAPEYNIYEMLQ